MLTLTAATLAVLVVALIVGVIAEHRATVRRRAVETQLALVDLSATLALESARLTARGF